MSQATSNFVSKCKQFWDEADADENGSLSIQELTKIIRKVCTVELTDPEIATMFANMDDDGSKTLTWDEFEEVFTKKDPKAVQQSELNAAFKQMDKNGSGYLSADEIRAQYKALKIDVSEEDLEAKISKADTDGNGQINFQEFLKAWQ